MSLKLLSWAFDQELPCIEKFVLVALADAASLEGICRPSQAFLAARCGICRQRVNEAIADLRRRGLIEVIARARANGTTASCEYRVVSPLTTPEEADVSPRTTPRVAQGDTSLRSNLTGITVESPDGDSPPPIVPPRVLEALNGRGTKGSRLAIDWQPCAEDIAFAEGLGLDPGRIAAEFADYWHARAGSGGVKLDWCATWRNWCRRAEPGFGGRGQAWRPSEKPGPVAAAMHSVMSRRGMG